MVKDSSSKDHCFPPLFEWNHLYMWYKEVKKKSTPSFVPLHTTLEEGGLASGILPCVTRETLQVATYTMMQENNATMTVRVE